MEEHATEMFVLKLPNYHMSSYQGCCSEHGTTLSKFGTEI
jgi:hypothetical protein